MMNREKQRLGDYLLHRFLGAGTFGDVYLGEHVYLQTPVAVKVFKTQLTPNKLKDFISEVRTVLLKHPHIVDILDFGIDEGDIPYIVMEYASHGTLVQKHPRGIQVPVATIIPYVKQIAAGLQFAHDNRRIHRDVKPENMLFKANNDVVISDFGLAVVAHNTRSQRVEDKNGTPLYMAPEQWRKKPLPASDQYALGIIVYEWLCGECPFEGDEWQLMNQHLNVMPPLMRSKLPTVSPAIEQVVMTTLAKEPAQRFATIQAFATALEQASHDRPLPRQYSVPPTSRPDTPSAPLPTASADATMMSPMVTSTAYTEDITAAPSLASLPTDAQLSLDTLPPLDLFNRIIREVGKNARNAR